MSRISFDPDSIRALANILVETGLTEIEITEKDNRVRVARAAVPAAVALPAAPIPAPVASSAAAVPPVAERDDAKHPGAVLSPMVGVAYLAAEPGAPPYVMPGQAVTAGQTLLLIEAMKTFNQIKAPRAGTVARILVGSGVPVEYGEPLMIIE
jgi:acetyl-CoA carboxylase biotin carboxyl carrier protein